QLSAGRSTFQGSLCQHRSPPGLDISVLDEVDWLPERAESSDLNGERLTLLPHLVSCLQIHAGRCDHVTRTKANRPVRSLVPIPVVRSQIVDYTIAADDDAVSGVAMVGIRLPFVDNYGHD